MKKQWILSLGQRFSSGAWSHLVLVLIILAAGAAAQGATLTVTNASDTNDGMCDANCSLREAVAAAMTGDTIVFASPTFDSPVTISISGQITINKSLIINGRGANLTTVRNVAAAGGTSRVFLITTGTTVNLSGLTIAGGNLTAGVAANGCGPTTVCGGGIHNSGNLTLTNSAVSGNSASGGLVIGGGIYSIGGTLTLINSTISGNNSNSGNNFALGGGIHIQNNGATVINSTISGNSAVGSSGGQGGGINLNGSSVLNITNSTFTDNFVGGGSDGGGGIYAGNTATINAVNTIISGNTAPALSDLRGTPTAGSINNLIGGGAGLRQLSNYGGTTQTHALAPDSPAVDAGSNCVLTQTCAVANPPFALTTDQRGRGRIGQVDIGAFEAPANTVVTNTADSGAGSLRAAITAANATNDDDSITFAIPSADANCASGVCTITLTSGELAVSATTAAGSLTVVNTNRTAGSIVISGNNASRVFNVASGGNLTINSLTVTGGNDNSNLGGGILNSGTLAVINCIVRGNRGRGGGGIGMFNGSNATLINSTVSGNSAGSGGGIYVDFATALTVTNSTINGNSAVGSGSGGIDSSGTVTMTNSTISGNSTNTGLSSGIYIGGGTVTMTNCTVTANSASNTGGTGGIYAAGGTVNARNTIISGNSAPMFPNLRGSLSAASQNNLVDDANIRLAPLGNYGGATQTHALLSGSSAINTGNNCVLNSTCANFNAPTNLTTDQRGAARVGQTDIGAFELNNSANGGNFKANLPDALKSASYNFTITSNNGTTNYSLTGGALPNGVNLTTNFAPEAVVALTGTPTEAGIFNFQITATNGANSNVTDYVLRVLAPTAAGVSISGRVWTPLGKNLTGATVYLTLANGETRQTSLSWAGNYRFDGIPAGQTVIITVFVKRYRFAPQIVSVTEDLTEVNFAPMP